MAYRVLSRKWRPQVFEDVIGQDHVVKTLANAVRQNRIAHAFLFSGPRGIGKTSIARIFSKAVNCEKGPTETPCNVCINCREIKEGISMDVHEIDGASNRGIDEIRELRENVKFSPVSSRYKIYIIDEVHMLTREAFNALLKTLEEPPGHVIFIFATTETHKVPSTILSRCQCFDFRRISLKQIGENLRRICESESVQVSDAGLLWIAEAADGSARDAQSILDQIISYSGQQIKDEDIQDLLGLTDRRFLFAFSDAVLARDAARCLNAVEEAYYAGVDMKFFYQMLLNHFRNLLLLKILDDKNGSLEMTADELTSMKAQIKGVSRETLQRHLDILMGEEENIRKSLNPRLNLESILVKMAYLEPVVPIHQIISRIENIEQRLLRKPMPAREDQAPNIAEPSAGEYRYQKGPVPEAAGPQEAPDHPPLTDGADAGCDLKVDSVQEEPYELNPDAFRKTFLDFARMKNPRLASKIEPGKLRFEDNCLIIIFPIGYIFFEDIIQPAVMEQLQKIVEAFFKREVKIKIETIDADDYDNEIKKNRSNQKISDIKREALQAPLLQKVLDVFPEAEVREVLHRTNHKNEH